MAINNSINNSVGGANSGTSSTFVITNTSNTASSAAKAVISVGGASAGDPITSYVIDGVTTWSVGAENASGDAFVVAEATSLGTNDSFRISSGGETFVLRGDFNVSRSANGSGVISYISNTSNTASSAAKHLISVGGSSADDPVTIYSVPLATTWALGVDNSDSDKFKLSASATLGSSDMVTVDTSGNMVVTGSVTAYRPIVTQADSATFALTDSNTWQKCTKATAMTLTVPLNATIAFPIGTEIDVYQQGAGQVTIAAAGGVTINSAFSNLKIAAQYTGASLKKTATDTWELVGNLTA